MFSTAGIGTRLDFELLRKKSNVDKIQTTYQDCFDAIRSTVDFVRAECGIDSARLLGGISTMVPFVHYLRKRRSPIFATWLAILSRGPVAARWRSFGNFYRDVHPKPSWRCLLVRDDVTGEFSPENCRWQIAKWYRWRRRPDGSKQNCAA